MVELVWKGKYDNDKQGSFKQEQQERTIQRLTSSRQLLTKERYPLNSEDANDTTKTNPPWSNRLILGDKSDILPALLPEYAASIDLIYIDPPFMTGRTFGKGTEIAYKDVWNNDIDTYLQWLYETLLLLHTLLAPSGSLYIHLDWRVIHYAKILLDEIFGMQADGAGFKNEIIWHYQSGGRPQKSYARKHDTILLYTKTAQYCFHGERVGERRGIQRRNHMRKETGEDGHITWTIRSAGRLYAYDEDTLISLSDVWSDISHLHQKDPERTGYATQKPEALIERIILASSEENDLVFDCFCGSGVTPAIAERLGRRWIACDKSALAIAMTGRRLTKGERKHSFVIQHVAKIG